MKKRPIISLVAGSIAVAGLVFGSALPANASIVSLGPVTTSKITQTTEWEGTAGGHYFRFSIHPSEGYNYATSTVFIQHMNITTSTTFYAPRVGSSAWSIDNLDYANVVKIGNYMSEIIV